MVKRRGLLAFTKYQVVGSLRESFIREQHAMMQRVLPAFCIAIITTLVVFLTEFDDMIPRWFNVYISVPFLLFMTIRAIYWCRSFLKGPEPQGGLKFEVQQTGLRFQFGRLQVVS